MKKTKIAFEDIKAGDLLEVVIKVDGVKSVITGIAFEQTGLQIGEHDVQVWWDTSEGGMIVNKHEESDIYRVDVAEVTFDDIRKGDLVRVTTRVDDMDIISEGVADHLVATDADWYAYWSTKSGHVLLHRGYGDRTIEILKREGE